MDSVLQLWPQWGKGGLVTNQLQLHQGSGPGMARRRERGAPLIPRPSLQLAQGRPESTGKVLPGGARATLSQTPTGRALGRIKTETAAADRWTPTTLLAIS